MSNIDWSQIITKQMKDEETAKRMRAQCVVVETSWQIAEMRFITDQLLALDDEDPAAEPGTEREWRDYRIQVRAWKQGAEGFPDSDKRPARPS